MVYSADDDDDVADPAPLTATTRHWYTRLSRVVSRYERVEVFVILARVTQFPHESAYVRRCTRKCVTGRADDDECDHDTVCASSLCRWTDTDVGAFGLLIARAGTRPVFDADIVPGIAAIPLIDPVNVIVRAPL